MSIKVTPLFPVFTDIDGQPLENGKIYVGSVNVPTISNPIQAYWDKELTIPASQPITTIGGYPSNGGTPSPFYVAESYSLLVQNKNGTQVYTSPVAADIQNTVDPREYGAIPTSVDPTADSTAALNQAFATGMVVDGGGLTYNVTASEIIDSSATAGVGYGPSKAWFLAGVCQNITFVGDVCFGRGVNFFLGKHHHIEKVTVNGDARLSSWYTTWQGCRFLGTAYINGDFPPAQNLIGCYFNQYINTEFVDVVVDQRYGPFNLNNFTECKFTSFHVKNTGDVGYNPGSEPFKDFHLNTFIGCEWLTFTGSGIIAPDTLEYPFVIDDAANVGGINRFIAPYMEGDARGFYGRGIQADNVHNSGLAEGTKINAPAGNYNRMGYSSPISGESGFIQRDIPHVYPAGQLATGGDWSILNNLGFPYCYETNMTTSVAADSTEPTGLGKALTVSGAAFTFFDLVPQVNDISTSVKNLYSYAIVYKLISGGNPIPTAYDAAGAELYGTQNIVVLDNGWIMITGHTYGKLRFTAGSTFSFKVSAASMGRGAGVISPFSAQRNNTPLIDLSNGPSILKDYFQQTLNTSGLAGYRHGQQKTMNLAGGNYDFYTITLNPFSAQTINLRCTFSLLSTAAGARYFYRESALMVDGTNNMQETNIHNITGANGSLQFVLSGNTITVRATSNEVTNENGKLAVDLFGEGIGYTSLTVL